MYDLIIIGAGPGGYETALEAAKRDLKVLLAEFGPVGGTCLNEGCIPTKALCRNAEIWENVKNSATFGITAQGAKLDFSKVQERKVEVMTQLRTGVETLLKHKNITLVHGKATMIDAHTVEVDGEKYEAKNIIIATGSVSAMLPIPGTDLPGVLTSKELLEIEHIPERLCIIGAGVIGLEFASIFNSFGSQVTVVEYCKDILPRFDTDLAKRLKQSLSKKGIEIYTQAQVSSIAQAEPDSDGKSSLNVNFIRKDKEESVSADVVLMAVGRKANLNSLNFEEMGIATSRRGVEVNDFMETSVPGVYAIGDINGRMMLAHTATYQGLVALDHIMGLENKIRLDVMPAAVFTHPEVGVVGLTEDDCKAQGIKVKVLKAFHRANGKAVSMGETEGFCKLIVSEDNGLILGCHLFGEHSADIVQEVCALISTGAHIDDLKAIVHPHPTLCEVVQTAAHTA